MFCVADTTKPGELKAFRKKLRLTQGELAADIGVTRSQYANWEAGTSQIPQHHLESLRLRGFQGDVSEPRNIAAQIDAPIRFIGTVGADTLANWVDPFESEIFEYVPPEMADRLGRFAARVASDSMMDFLQPDDIIVLQHDPTPRIGRIVLYRSAENKLAIKQLAYRDGEYYLHSLNPAYEDIQAYGQVVGYLVGVVRMWGTKRMTVYDPSGLTP